MQLRSKPTKTIDALALATEIRVPDEVTVVDGITIVEEDDIAFTLGLCREVDRIYGAYQRGEVTATQSLEAGLTMTVEMLAVLTQAVDAGMPALRIGVAAAQITEMLAVLFGRNWIRTPLGPQLRERYRSIMSETAHASTAPVGPSRPVGPDHPVRPGRRGLMRLFRPRVQHV